MGKCREERWGNSLRLRLRFVTFVRGLFGFGIASICIRQISTRLVFILFILWLHLFYSLSLFLSHTPTPFPTPFAAGFFDCLRCQQLCSLGLSKLLCHVCQILCHACSQHSTVRACVCVCVCVRVLHATFVHMLPHTQTVVVTSAAAAPACGRHYYGWALAFLPLLHLFVNLKRPSKQKERQREGERDSSMLHVASCT